MEINDPETVAELTALYPEYEAALVNNDIETMQRLFWSSPYVVRFGATENLHGIDEIAAFRAARPSTNLCPPHHPPRYFHLRVGILAASTWSSNATETAGVLNVAVRAKPGCACRRDGEWLPRTSRLLS